MLYTATSLAVYQISESTPVAGVRMLSIGNLCRFEAVFDTDKAQAPLDPAPDGEFFLNFGLFLPPGFALENPSSPSGNYFYAESTGKTLNTAYQLDYVGQQEARPGIWSIIFEEQAGNLRIKVVGTFALLEDVDGYLSSVRNSRRLLFNSINAVDLLENNGTAVFNTNRVLRLSLYFKEAPIPPATRPVWSYGKADQTVTERWYNSDEYGGVATLVANPSFTLLRNNQPVTGISAFEDTALRFECRTTQSNPHVVVWIIQEGAVNGQPFLQAIKADIATVPNSGSNVPLPVPYGLYTQWGGGTVLYSPSFQLFNVVGDLWRTQFIIKASQLTPGASYRVIVVVNYEQAVNKLASYSFISSSLTADTPPPLIPPLITGMLRDYNSEYGNAIQCAPYERLESELSVNYNVYDAKRIAFSGGWFAALQRIEVSLYYLESIYRQVVEKHSFTRNGNGNGTWNANGKGEVNIDPYSYEMQMKYPFRIRSEQNTANVVTLIESSQTPVAPANGNQDWTGKTIYVEYKFILDYQNPISFQDELIFTQVVAVKAFDETTMTIELQEQNGDPLRVFCSGGTDCYVKVTDLNNSTDANFIAITDKEIFSLPNVKEYESYSGLLARLSESPLVSADLQFDNATHIAKAKISAPALITDRRYRVGAIRKAQGFQVALNVTCNTATACPFNGQIVAVPSGGTPPYTYKWNNMPQSLTAYAGALPPNNVYTVEVKDASDRLIRKSVELCNNAIPFPNEPLGNALFFIPQYLDKEDYPDNNTLVIPPISAYNFGTNPFSVALFAKLSGKKDAFDLVEEQWLIGSMGFASALPGGCTSWRGWGLYLRYISANIWALKFVIHKNTGQALEITSGNLRLNYGQWYHFCAVRDPGTINTKWKLYANGCLLTTTTSDTTGSGGTDSQNLNYGFPIWAGNQNKGRFSECPVSAKNLSLWGMLDEILLYNKALSASEVFGLYNYNLGGIPPAGNLVGRWRLNENGVDNGSLFGSANGSEGRIIAPDTSPYNNPAQLHNFGIRPKATFPVGTLPAWVNH